MTQQDTRLELLHVIYDADCGFCTRCRRWMEHQPKLLHIQFVAAGSADVRRMFPSLHQDGTSTTDELVVVDNLGGVYRGSGAWLMCLWALVGYRQWSYRLADRRLLPFTRRAFAYLSSHRYAVSRLLGQADDTNEAVQRIEREPEPSCARVEAAGAPGLTMPAACPLVAASRG